MDIFSRLQNVSEFEWLIPGENQGVEAHLPIRLFASRKILDAIKDDKSLDQAANAARLPGLVGEVIVMPDVHQGYGFPIGGVAASSYPDGVVSPGAIGYDINCGVRLLSSGIELGEAKPYLDSLADALYHSCPSGMGSRGGIRLTNSELEQVCHQGLRWAARKGYASEQDIRRTEDGGSIEGADIRHVSKRALERGSTQLGTLGSGNHFVEIAVVERVFDQSAGDIMGIRKGCLTLSIHCGSRGLGHQICTDYVQTYQSLVHRLQIRLPDRELVYAPMDTPEGSAYLAAMNAAANFAFVNRQLLAAQARKAFEQALRGKVAKPDLFQVYDLAHNMGKIEMHSVGGQLRKVCVHRKGATRAFGPNSPGLPAEYSSIGQPVLIPGSMGTASWVLAGTTTSMERAFGSSCHGAGRLLSRSQAKRHVRGDILRSSLQSQGIYIRTGSLSGLAEEAPSAYKDVDEVVQVVTGVGIAKKVARLRPLVVIKG